MQWYQIICRCYNTTMRLSTQPYKGARDFYPEDMLLRNYIFDVWKKVLKSYGYVEYDGPFIENFELFEAKSGSELVNEQLYSFTDRGERKVAIRPEMTPTLARMVAGRYKTLLRPIRWYSIPNLWRYEKPQRGRLREFFQLNVDVFGVETVSADFELLSIAIAIMQEFKAPKSSFVIKINNRRFMDSFFTQIGITSNQSYVLKKAIDKKAKLTSLDFEKLLLEEIGLTQEQRRSLNALFDNPQIYLDQPYASELKDLLTLIEKNGIKEYVQFDPSIMRGLDYYTGNVFEQFDLNPENTRAMYGGGRYDDLVKLFTGDNLTGIGFGMGDVTLLNFLESWKLVPQLSNTIDYLVTVWPQPGFFGVSTNIASLIRELGYSTQVWLEETTALEKQLKYGVKANVANIILIGPNEIENNTVTIKELASSQQKTIPLADFLQSIKKVS